MDVSGEVADLMLKESIEATEKTVRLTASGIKNVAALLIALARSSLRPVRAAARPSMSARAAGVPLSQITPSR